MIAERIIRIYLVDSPENQMSLIVLDSGQAYGFPFEFFSWFSKAEWYLVVAQALQGSFDEADTNNLTWNELEVLKVFKVRVIRDKQSIH